MQLTYYVAIYKWGNIPNSVHDNSSGTTLHSSLENLYIFEPNAIAYYEVNGKMPTKEEFNKEHKQEFTLTEEQLKNWITGSLLGNEIYSYGDKKLTFIHPEEVARRLIHDLKNY